MKPILAAVLVLAAAACAPQAPAPAPQLAGAPGQQCFHAGSVNGFRDVDDETVDLTVGPNEVYRVQVFGLCPDLDQVRGVGVRTRGASSWVCQGADMELVVPMSFGPRACPARSLRKLTHAEIAAGRER